MPEWIKNAGGVLAGRLTVHRGAETRPAEATTIEQRIETHYLELWQKLYAYLAALGASTADAEELTQEAFVRLYQQLLNHTEITNVRAWLFRTVRNLYINDATSWRSTAFIPQTDAQAVASRVPDLLQDPEGAAIRNERSQKLERAMLKLTSLQIEYLHLRADGLRYREIGEIYGVAVATVQDVVRRAVEQLGKEF